MGWAQATQYGYPWRPPGDMIRNVTRLTLVVAISIPADRYSAHHNMTQ